MKRLTVLLIKPQIKIKICSMNKFLFSLRKLGVGELTTLFLKFFWQMQLYIFEGIQN